MELRGRRALVTGAEGFIGSHLAEELVRRGCSVRALVLYNSMSSCGWLADSPPEIRAQIEVVAGDLRDQELTHAAVKGCDVVFHLAALIGIPYSYRSPHSYVDTNVKGTLNVLLAARDLEVARVVHTSTSEVYGSAREVPVGEDHPLHAQSPYAATKIAADQLALSFHASYATPVALMRPFNVYGPRQSTRAFIPALLIQLAGGGRTVRLGSLHPTRDFSYVTDTVRGFIAVAEADAAVGEVINIGSDFEISIGETVRLIGEILGREIEITMDHDRVRPAGSEVTRLRADTSKAQRLLGWQPAYGGREGLRRGLRQTADWFADSRNLARYRLDGGHVL